jgi:hypothetical protein
MAELEKLAKQIMKEAEADGEPVTLEEALEMAQMEVKAKTSGADKVSVGAAPKKERKPRPLDAEKVEIIKKFYDFILTNLDESATIINEQREVAFGEYSIQLIKHRAKKGD